MNQDDTSNMARTLKLANDCDEEVHFERQVKRELLRLHDLLGKSNALARIRAERIAELEDEMMRCKTAMHDMSAAIAYMEVKAIPASEMLRMCADHHCPEYATCYRAQSAPSKRQPFFAVSPRDGAFCDYYAPMRFSDGKTAMRGEV
jgi:hypothetical protein